MRLYAALLLGAAGPALVNAGGDVASTAEYGPWA
jgi:hypothetical protein